MDTLGQIETYIAEQPEPKRSDMQALHRLVLQIMPGGRLWFLDGRNEDGKVVANPNIGYGFQTIRYADGRTREFYQIGLSANTTGISVYILGLEDRTYLARTYAKALGKARVSGYCVNLKTLADVNTVVLEDMLRYAIDATSEDQP